MKNLPYELLAKIVRSTDHLPSTFDRRDYDSSHLPESMSRRLKRHCVPLYLVSRGLSTAVDIDVRSYEMRIAITLDDDDVEERFMDSANDTNNDSDDNQDGGTDSAFQTAWLEKSRGCDIEVFIHIAPRCVFETFQNAVDKIMPYVSQLTVLNVLQPETQDFDCLGFLVTSMSRVESFPRLRVLDIVDISASQTPSWGHLTSKMPALESVVFFSPPSSWTVSSFCINLIVWIIDASQLAKSQHIEVLDLFHIIKHSPHLMRMELTLPNLQGTLGSAAPIYSSSLRHVTVNSGVNVAADLLSKLRFNELEDLSIGQLGGIEFDSEFAVRLASQQGNFRGLESLSLSVCKTYSDMLLRFFDVREIEYLTLSAAIEDINEFAQSPFDERFRNSNLNSLTHLSIVDIMWLMQECAFFSCAHLPALRNLVLHYSEHGNFQTQVPWMEESIYLNSLERLTLLGDFRVAATKFLEIVKAPKLLELNLCPEQVWSDTELQVLSCRCRAPLTSVQDLVITLGIWDYEEVPNSFGVVGPVLTAIGEIFPCLSTLHIRGVYPPQPVIQEVIANATKRWLPSLKGIAVGDHRFTNGTNKDLEEVFELMEPFQLLRTSSGLPLEKFGRVTPIGVDWYQADMGSTVERPDALIPVENAKLAYYWTI